MKKFYAHSLEGEPTEEWHRLEEHLNGTAELAALFAAEFECGEWGYLAGLWQGGGIDRKGVNHVSQCRLCCPS